MLANRRRFSLDQVAARRTLRRVITGELKNKVDRVWDSFWSGGISNPLEVIEQITYLLFLRRLDDLQSLAEKKARLAGGVIDDPKFLPGQEHLRWSRFKNLDADVMFKTVATEVFPFLQKYDAQVGGDDSTYSDHMKDARFTISNAAIALEGRRHARPDLDGQPGHQRRPVRVHAQQDRDRRHQRAVPHPAPHHPADGRDDRAAARRRALRPRLWQAGFLVAASEYVRSTHPSALTDAKQRQHFHRSMFHGYDFDNVMLRIGSMNMLLHGIEAPDIRYRDSLSEGASEDTEKYTLILANPPFAGSLDHESTTRPPSTCRRSPPG